MIVDTTDQIAGAMTALGDVSDTPPPPAYPPSPGAPFGRTKRGRPLAADGYVDDTPREAWVKLPTFLVPTLARPLNPAETEQWVIGSFLANYVQLNGGTSPSLQLLSRIAGRKESTVRRVCEQLVANGFIGMAKVKNQYKPNGYGKKWRYWIPASSPLRDIMGKGGKPWIPVPASVARSTSTLKVGAFLCLHEQMRIDGAITTTATDLSGLLMCAPRTARKLLVDLGCVPVGTPVPGRAVYTMPIDMQHREIIGNVQYVAHPTLQWEINFPIYGRRDDTRRAEAVRARWNEVWRLLATQHHRTRFYTADWFAARFAPDTCATVVLRFLEEMHRTWLIMDSGYRRRLWKRFSARLRHTKLDREVRAAREDRQGYDKARDEALQALASADCPTCRGDKLVETDGGAWAACHSCSG